MLFKDLVTCQPQRFVLVRHRRIITSFLLAVPVLACGGDDSKVHLYVQNNELVWLLGCLLIMYVCFTYNKQMLAMHSNYFLGVPALFLIIRPEGIQKGLYSISGSEY